MMTIEYKSLSDHNERETVRPMAGTIQLASLAQYLEERLCPVQRETRAALPTPACPPSGHGSDRPTVRPGV